MKLRALALTAVAAVAAVPILLTGPGPAQANHSWGNYHWARTSNPFTLSVGDNVPSGWDPYLAEAITDWNKSTVLRLENVPGAATSSACTPTQGRIEVCAANYGENGWLGIAQIWISGSHITQATAKMNDWYFSQARYNTPPWRRLVMCQEIAHDFGLDHQNTAFYNKNRGTCMDYTNDPDGGGFYGPSNEHPNTHDYDQLKTIYAHLTDGTTTVGPAAAGSGQGRSGTAADPGPNNPRDFGRPTGEKDGHGRDILFAKDLPDGGTLFTHVFWALPERPVASPR